MSNNATCKNCRWWRSNAEEKIGQCMHKKSEPRFRDTFSINTCGNYQWSDPRRIFTSEARR